MNAPLHSRQQSDKVLLPVPHSGSPIKVLLSSVFGPYAQDDQYGSRRMNPMELYHNQVTRVQGPFSLRMFHRSWGLMFIQSNIEAPCTLLDFPTLDRFVEEIQRNEYDVVGISGIGVNILKVMKMCELVRQHLPHATIVVGGHIANIPDLDTRIDADHIVRGEGVRWFRKFLNEDPNRPYRHPVITSGIGTRTMGVAAPDKPEDIAATVIPSVGCPIGCNFCSTSAMFGGKGKFINFYQTGDELFEIMHQLEERMQVHSFFMMDENFLLHRKRALRLLELMEANNKAWSLNVFSSANVLCTYTMEQLVGLGVSWVWMGLEGENSCYNKLRGIDTHALVRRLQAHGIRVLGSSIIGLENHTPENMDQVIDYAVRFNTDFHQFMLYTPIPGTPLHDELVAQGLMKDPNEYEDGDIHGQAIFNYRHPHIKHGQETEYMERAFLRDFEVNGPSIMRVFRTTLAGWKRYKNHPNQRIRRRFYLDAKGLSTTYSAAVSAAKMYYKKNRPIFTQIRSLQRALYQEFGFKSRLMSMVGGPFIFWKMHREKKRLANGWTYEPPTFYEKNYDAGELPASNCCAAALCQQVDLNTIPSIADTEIKSIQKELVVID